MKTVLLKPEEIQEHKEDILQWIDRAKEHSAGERTVEDILDSLTTGRAQCWCILSDGKIINMTITEIIDYQNKRVLHIVFSAGDGWEGYKEEHTHLEDFAKSLGCVSITVWGRKGWEKVLPNFGYTHIYSVFERKLV